MRKSSEIDTKKDQQDRQQPEASSSGKKPWVKPAAAVEEVARVTKLTAAGSGKDGVACHS